MRRLLVVPVIHNHADLGSLAEAVRARYEADLGPAAWNQREQAVAKLWNTIRERIERLHLDYQAVRVYQDGLPVCGHEIEIARELAAAGSLNHQLVVHLVDQGATLMGTEDPRLLIREYQMHRRQIGRRDAGDLAASCAPDEAASLLEARDRFIAEQIARTLCPGETGLLFLGAAHRVDALQSFDIEVETLG